LQRVVELDLIAKRRWAAGPGAGPLCSTGCQ
jgi:hypothetical protein